MIDRRRPDGRVFIRVCFEEADFRRIEEAASVGAVAGERYPEQQMQSVNR